MRKKIIYLLFILCLIKLYDIADRSLKFSPKLLINSFQKNAGEKSSLNFTTDDIIPIRNFFLSKDIHEFKLSEKIIKNDDVYYLALVEFNYPINVVQNASILVANRIEDEQSNCELLYSTENFNIYECN